MLTVNTDYHWPVPNLWVIGYKSQNVKNLRVYSYCMRFAQYQYIVTLAFLLYCFLQTRDRIRIIGYSLTYGHTRSSSILGFKCLLAGSGKLRDRELRIIHTQT
jgi:hypothetical protein